MTLSATQSLSGDTFSKEERALLRRLQEAVGRPVEVYASSPASATGEDTPSWRCVATTGQPSPPAQPAPTGSFAATLRKASQSGQAELARAESNEANNAAFAIRLGAWSGRIAVVRGQAGEGDLLRRLLETTTALHVASSSADDLTEENDLFAAQLASDLEELTFLRSMVESLTNGRASSNLCSLAQATLPVLNATVRARCMAFLSLPNPADAYTTEVGSLIGEAPLDHGTLELAVRRFGPSATRGPLVKNWDVANLPDAATLWEDAEHVPGVRSLVIVPLTSGERMLGWLVAANRERCVDLNPQSSWQLCSDEFGSGEATLMATTASILATHAANLELIREKELLMVSMVRSLVSAIESKDKYTRGHSERVALYTQRLARQIGYNKLATENIYLSALLHDVGKIGVSDAVLKKEGKLTEEEYAEIARHPDEGWAILCDLDQLQAILPGVLHHHERWDGRGYPDNLQGIEIPIDGRVMAVADAYDAMTSDRPYRAGMPTEKAEAILRDGAGTQWDPECVAAFLDCIDDIRRIKAEYKQRERKVREPKRSMDEKLPHEIVI